MKCRMKQPLTDLEQMVLECLCELPVRDALFSAVKERDPDATDDEIEAAWESVSEKVIDVETVP